MLPLKCVMVMVRGGGCSSVHGSWFVAMLVLRRLFKVHECCWESNTNVGFVAHGLIKA